jgi:hypothetical protein
MQCDLLTRSNGGPITLALPPRVLCRPSRTWTSFIHHQINYTSHYLRLRLPDPSSTVVLFVSGLLLTLVLFAPAGP